ncbi:hypothetical protein ACH5RR_015842 [Cinchona calisaya]|uniref:Uncharacterized protein n=1 Tax=Cinchona calisaya TaxID=153742 RepID=A0ABD2ZZP5_9GENT
MEGHDTCYDKDVLNNEVSSSSKVRSSSSSKPSQEKRRTTTIDIVSEEINPIKEGLDVVVATLDRENFRNYSEDQLYQEIEKVDGMNDISEKRAHQNSTEDMGTARAFFGCPAEHRRLRLTVKYGQYLFDT